jgi:PiT family inorganic phosphate transporter
VPTRDSARACGLLWPGWP